MAAPTRPTNHVPDRPGPASADAQVTRNLLLRRILFAGGLLFSALAFIGAVLPLVPTTPFLLAAAACFARSSTRFYNLIMYNRFFGHYLRDYNAGRGVPVRVKVTALAFTWGSTLVSVIFFIPYLWLDIVVLLIPVIITLHLLFLKTKRKSDHPDESAA